MTWLIRPNVGSSASLQRSTDSPGTGGLVVCPSHIHSCSRRVARIPPRVIIYFLCQLITQTLYDRAIPGSICPTPFISVAPSTLWLSQYKTHPLQTWTHKAVYSLLITLLTAPHVLTLVPNWYISCYLAILRINRRPFWMINRSLGFIVHIYSLKKCLNEF